jgi:DNA-binding CsgD family transcriptional regulator
MRANLNIVNFFSSPLAPKFDRLASPLADCFGIDLLIYTRINVDGSFFQIGNYPELFDYYWNHTFFKSNPFIRHPSLYTTGTQMLTEAPSLEFQQSQEKVRPYYKSNEMMGFFFKNEENLEWIAFSTRDEQLPIVTTFINERHLLGNFCSYLRNEWKPHLSKMDRYSVDMQSLLGPDFTKMPVQVPENRKEQKIEFLKETQLGNLGSWDIPQFSLREKECISLWLKGRNCAEIALKLGLSKRTVESYMENIKNKIGTSGKAETIEILSELSALNLL